MATTGRLTADQRAAAQAGRTIRQTWKILVPTSSAHTAYNEYSLDDGIHAGPEAVRRVLRAGRRTHKVWNPSPMVDNKPAAVRYAFTVSNKDGRIYENSADNIFQVPSGYQAMAQECRIKHQIFILLLDGTWSEIDHMAFTGGIISLIHEDIGGPDKSAVGAVTTITCEQLDAWTGLRRVWTIDDGTHSPMTGTGTGSLDFTWTVT